MTTPDTLFFYYDYVDPVSYTLKHRLQETPEIGRLILKPRPIELNPPPSPLLDPEGEEVRRLWGRMSEEGQALGVELRQPWIVPWTRKAHELAFHATENDCFEEIHEAIFRAYLIEGRDIGRVDILVEIARNGGLDPQDTKAVLDVDRYREAVEEARAKGLGIGINTLPTLVWNEKKLEGNPDSETLRSFLAFGTEREKP